MTVTYTNQASIAVVVKSVTYGTAVEGTSTHEDFTASGTTNATRTYTSESESRNAVGNNTITWTLTYETLYGDQTRTCSANLAVRYRPPVVHCSVRTENDVIETTTSDNIIVTVWYDGTNVDPNGRVTTVIARANGNNYTTPSPSIPAGGYAATATTNYDFTFGPVTFPNPGTAIALAGSVTFTTTDGIGGSGWTVTVSPECSESTPVGDMPYLKEFGGDVLAGGVFRPTACSPMPTERGGIYAYNQGVAGDYAGASAQLTVTALLNVNSFASAGYRSGDAAGTIPAKGLTFSNTAGDGTYGGAFGRGQCITDYFYETRDNSLLATGSFPPDTLPAPTVPPQTGTVWADNPATVNFFNVTQTRRYRVTVNGTWTNRTGAADQYTVDAYCQNNTGSWQVVNDFTLPTNHDLQINNNFVTWRRTSDGAAACSPTNEYYYDTGNVPATGQMSLRIFDGNSSTNTIEPTWYTDNQYGLSFSVECTDCPAPPATPGAFPAGRSQYVLPAGNQTIPALNVPAGSQIAVYVAGNAYITGDIRLAATGFGNHEAVPYFTLIVCGNIFIDNDVTQLDGLYVAQPGTYNSGTGRCDPPADPVTSASGTIYTCAIAANTYCPANTLTADGNKQLSINGAVVANRIKWLRSYQSLRLATNTEVPDFGTGAGTNAAEVINYTPHMWLAPSPLKRLNESPGGDGSYGPYEFIRSLPPVFNSGATP